MTDHIETTKKENKPILVVEDPIFQDFIIDRNLTKETVISYKNRLQKYVNFTGKSLTDLLEEAEHEQDKNVRPRKRKIKFYLANFKQYMLNEEFSLNYVKSSLRTVKSFYNEFDIDLPRERKRQSRKLTEKRTISDLPSFDEINRFLDKCNNVYRAILVLGLSSGMGRAEIASLTFKHLYEGLEISLYPKTIPEVVDVTKTKIKQGIIPKWNIIRIKTGNEYFTFSSLQSLERLVYYLEDYHYKYPEFKPKPEDQLIRSTFNGEPLSAINIGNTINVVNHSHGFRIAKDGHHAVRSHTMRKLFASLLEKHKVPYLETKWLLGHKVVGSDGAYFYPDPEEIKDDYINVMEHLTTDKSEIKIINSLPEIMEEFEEMKIKQTLYERKIEALEAKKNKS